MKNFFYLFIVFYFSAIDLFALENITGIENKKLREGNVNLDDIPNVIGNLISIGIYLAGSVSIVFVIIGAYKILFGSLQGKTEGKDTVIMALGGLIISIFAWAIVKLVFDNFG